MFLSYQLADGGAERAISLLTKGFLEANYEVGLVLYVNKNNEYSLDDSIKVYRLNTDRIGTKSSLLRKIKRIRMIRDCLRDFQPDFCIPFLKDIVIETCIASQGKFPVIATIRNMPVETNSVAIAVRDWFYGKCDAVFMQTEEPKQYFGENIVNKAFAVPNAVDDNLINLGKKDVIRMLYRIWLHLVDLTVKKITRC